MSRILLHADLNTFYASVEALYRPKLRGKPFVVGGDESARHGIVLTKSQEAKKYGIKTGMSLMEARRLCTGLISVPADMPLYLRFSREFHEMLREYTDAEEAYGADEAWLDITNPGLDIQDGAHIADEIRARTKEEYGITCSVGVSFTKPFAKLGSDMLKPDGTTVISKENYKQIAWPLPVSDLLFAGPATTKTLFRFGIYSIGDLAKANPEWIAYKLGKPGLSLHAAARGEDLSPVRRCDVVNPVKSVGNSSNLPRDAVSLDDIKTAFAILADSIAHRMQEDSFRSRCIHVAVRVMDMSWKGCQRTIKFPTCLSCDLFIVAMDLFRDYNYAQLFPLRGVALRCTLLSLDTDPIQTDMFFDAEKYEAKVRLEKTVHELQIRFGMKSIQRCIMIADKGFAQINPNGTHVQPAAAYNY